jgi:glycosyltransferase involved in cell wall biosynthesis
MKLLIVTQKVDKNDQNLGFFHRWIIEFAKNFELVTVICLEEGGHELPANVKVLSLGKVRGQSPKVKSRTSYGVNFYRFIWSERKNYDAVFVHMNPEYIILGGCLWKILNKPITLWYTHKSVDLKLKIATAFADKIFTASKESFRLKSSKILVTGHGIDIDTFSPAARIEDTDRIISVGRISPTKNQMVMIKAFEILKKNGFAGTLTMVGDAITKEDFEYRDRICKYVNEHGLKSDVILMGAMSHEGLPDLYRRASVFVNLSSTGSIDKAVLEAMACGLRIVTSNEAFKNIVSPESFTGTMPEEVAQKIGAVLSKSYPQSLRTYVEKNHSLQALIPLITSEIEALNK